MGSNKVVSLNAVRELRDAERDDHAYQTLILSMDKLELLEEMVRFQEERSKIGHLTPTLMLRGKHLFKALEETAETRELRLLTSSYRRHLEYELSAYVRAQMQPGGNSLAQPLTSPALFSARLAEEE